jgi:hypothetical protein
MRFNFLIISAVLIFQVTVAQNDPASSTTATTMVSAASSATIMPTDPTPSAASPTAAQVTIMDYKSVYEAATVEEEVKMATERFNLTPSQQDVWLTAATDRRETERQARGMLESKATNYEKEPTYKGLRSAQNTFYETVIGYLSPAQKQALETDRLIHLEKQKRLAKLPPPPPPTPTVTVVPVDSAAIKQTEKGKGSGKKSKKKKQPIAR